MATFHGLIIYEILDNGNILSGIYTNNSKTPYEISSEIVKKDPYDTDSKDIEGIYKSRYIETNPDPNKVTNCELQVTKQTQEPVYEFIWSDKGIAFYRGLGIKVGSTHIAVSYTNDK